MRTRHDALSAGDAGEGYRSARRSRRVTVLLVCIGVLSVADLVITLTHLRTVGMAEANPVAAYIIRTTQSAWMLGAFKTATAGLCIALLHRLRREKLGEWASWASLGVLVWMALIWGAYSNEMDEPPAEAMVSQDGGEAWLRLD